MASPIEHVSDTAFWVATYRAQETQRPDALFRDPLAAKLVAGRGEQIAAGMAGNARYSYWTLVLRTCVIDSYIRKYIAEGCTTIINLGTGLDTRPYRMELPSTLQWIELDFPSIIAFKNEKLRDEKPVCQLERIAVDLSNAAETAKVFQALNPRIGKALVLTEGVIPYLTEATVVELGKTLASTQQIRYWVTEFYDKHLYARFQDPKFKKSLGGSPFQFFPDDWFGVFARAGWQKKELRFLYDAGEKLGRRFPVPWPVALLRAVLGGEAIGRIARLQAYMVFQKNA